MPIGMNAATSVELRVTNRSCQWMRGRGEPRSGMLAVSQCSVNDGPRQVHPAGSVERG